MDAQHRGVGFAAFATKGMLAAARRNTPYQQLVEDLATKVDTHPYRKVKTAR